MASDSDTFNNEEEEVVWATKLEGLMLRMVPPLWKTEGCGHTSNPSTASKAANKSTRTTPLCISFFVCDTTTMKK